MKAIDIRVAENGRMVLPASVRKALGLVGEAKLILTVEDDEVRLTPLRKGVSRARALYQQHARSQRSTDDFLEDRRSEADHDDGEVDGMKAGG